MEKRKAEKAKRAADKAAGIEPEKPKPKPAPKKEATQAERFRRASLVVDVAASNYTTSNLSFGCGFVLLSDRGLLVMSSGKLRGCACGRAEDRRSCAG